MSRPPLQEEVTGLVRTRVLDAVGELLHDAPWEKVSMAAVARQAGVSRQTVYNEFGARDDLAVSYVLRESERFLTDVEEAVTSSSGEMLGALASAVDVFMRAASDHPVLRRLARGDTSDALLSLVLSSSDAPVIQVATERLVAVLGRTWPDVPHHHVATLADAAVRLALSHATQPADPDHPEVDAAAIVDVLAPYIEQHR